MKRSETRERGMQQRSLAEFEKGMLRVHPLLLYFCHLLHPYDTSSYPGYFLIYTHWFTATVNIVVYDFILYLFIFSLLHIHSKPNFHFFLQVSHVLASLQAGNRGTQACITAASAVSGIIADLDTTIMFATAGTLNRENAETFADHRY